MRLPPDRRDDFIFGTFFGVCGIVLLIVFSRATAGLGWRSYGSDDPSVGDPIAAALVALLCLGVMAYWIVDYCRKRRRANEWTCASESETEEPPVPPSLSALIFNLALVVLALVMLMLSCIPVRA